MASILVTGANGFIGKHLVKALSEAHSVTQLDLHGYDPMPKDSYDGIIHLAAISRVRDGERDPVRCMQTNIIETATMLEIPHKWFIFAGTCEEPKNVYGFSKRAAEGYIKLRSQKYAIFRLSNVYGPGMSQDKLLPRLARGEITHLDDGVLPFEHIHVGVVVEMMRQIIPSFDAPNFKPLLMKLATGVAKTKEELMNVAASY